MLAGVITDLTAVHARLPVPKGQSEDVAQLLDRLAAEVTRASAMVRKGAT
jgi:hypothetical protein